MKDQICPISGEKMTPVFQEIVIGKYLVTYYYCQKSGILKTEQAYWLDEAYKSPIANTDTGLVQRNIANSEFLEMILQLLFKGEGRFVDISGGYGLLARLMRDKGFDFYTIDKYCNNLFASHFEPEIGFTAKALCAFEVLEHIEEPMKFLTEIFEKYNCKTLLFSTLTFTDDKIPPKNWWYYSFETGQHITFYQPRTLYCLAKSLGLQYYMINSNMHIITDIKLSNVYKLIFFNHRFQLVYRYFVKYKRQGISKTWEDHLLISNEIKRNSNV